jgi:hypothetical protein
MRALVLPHASLGHSRSLHGLRRRPRKALCKALRSQRGVEWAQWGRHRYRRQASEEELQIQI